MCHIHLQTPPLSVFPTDELISWEIEQRHNPCSPNYRRSGRDVNVLNLFCKTCKFNKAPFRKWDQIQWGTLITTGILTRYLCCVPHEEWVLLYLRKDTCMQKPSPLRDPLASLPSDRQRLAASNYILRRSIPLRYLGAIPRRALYWISRVSSVPVLGSRAKLGPGEKVLMVWREEIGLLWYWNRRGN